LLLPHRFTIGDLIDQFAETKKVFPFNVFFDFNDITQTAIASSTNMTGTSLTLNLAIPGQSASNVSLLTPTLLEDNVGSSTKNQIFTLLENGIWLLTAIGIIFLII